MQLKISIQYWLLFFKNGNVKYTTASQRLTSNFFLLFHIFYLTVFFIVISFQTLMHKETSHLQSILHIVYFEGFCYVMYYIVSEICIGAHFLEGYFHCYFWQIKFVAFNESKISYKLIKSAPYFLLVENAVIDLKLGTLTK